LRQRTHDQEPPLFPENRIEDTALSRASPSFQVRPLNISGPEVRWRYVARQIGPDNAIWAYICGYGAAAPRRRGTIVRAQQVIAPDYVCCPRRRTAVPNGTGAPRFPVGPNRPAAPRNALRPG